MKYILIAFLFCSCGSSGEVEPTYFDSHFLGATYYSDKPDWQLADGTLDSGYHIERGLLYNFEVKDTTPEPIRFDVYINNHSNIGTRNAMGNWVITGSVDSVLEYLYQEWMKCNEKLYYHKSTTSPALDKNSGIGIRGVSKSWKYDSVRNWIYWPKDTMPAKPLNIMDSAIKYGWQVRWGPPTLAYHVSEGEYRINQPDTTKPLNIKMKPRWGNIKWEGNVVIDTSVIKLSKELGFPEYPGQQIILLDTIGNPHLYHDSSGWLIERYAPDSSWVYDYENTDCSNLPWTVTTTKPLNIHIDTPIAISLYARLLADTPIRLNTTSDVYHQWSVQNDSVQSEIVRSDKTGEWVLGDNPGPALNLFYKMYMDLKKEKELAEDILKYLYTDGTVSNLKKFKAAVKEFSEYKKK